MDWAEASPENYQTFLRERRLWNAALLSYSLGQTQTATRSRFLFNRWQMISVAATIALLISLSWNFLHYDRGWRASAGLRAGWAACATRLG